MHCRYQETYGLWFICCKSYYQALITMFWSPHQLHTTHKGTQLSVLQKTLVTEQRETSDSYCWTVRWDQHKIKS
jgi:hypothetical protein